MSATISIYNFIDILRVVKEMKHAILLQIDGLTKVKGKTLREALDKAVSEANLMLSKVSKFSKFNDFHKAVYSVSKKNTSFNSQVICDIERQIWRKPTKQIKRITIKFNVPRNCKTFEKSIPFVRFSLFSESWIAVPLAKNRNWQRYSDLLKAGWTCKTYGLTSALQIVAYLSKDQAELPKRKNVLGVDVNSKCFAITVLSPDGKVLKQDYLGKDIWHNRKRIFERKSLLQSYADSGSGYAIKALRKTKTYEHDFVKNRIGEVIRDITELALKYDADIAIENLKRFSPKGKNFNREVMRIPFFAFKQNLLSRCFDKGITLDIVDAWHTSKFCNHCGAVGAGHSSENYALFRCKECGIIVNSDRNASKNIAIKSLLERKNFLDQKTFQISNRRVPVNGLVRPDAVVEPIVVQHVSSTYGKPTTFSRG